MWIKKRLFICTGVSPKELKLKDSYFSHQAEGRIIVNTDNALIREYLNNNPIEIGPIQHISEKVESYFHNGILVELTAEVYKLEEK